MVMVTLGNHLYVVGGYNYGEGGSNCRYTSARITATGAEWEPIADFPRRIHRHSGVAEEEAGRIWVVGGHDCEESRHEEPNINIIVHRLWIRIYLLIIVFID